MSTADIFIPRVPLFVGIDPGTQGGIVGISWPDERVVSMWNMPATREEVIGLFRMLTEMHECYAVIEGVHAMPGNSGRSMFTFGQGVGVLLTCMDVFRWSYVVEDPRVWQKKVGIRAKGKDEKKPQWKKRLITFANRTVGVNTTSYTADAALMALRSVAIWKNDIVSHSETA